MQVLISAGEASGDMYGAGLIQAVQRINPSIKFFGAGGEKMRAAGCDIVVDAKDLSVVGITEILSHLPKIWGLFRHLIDETVRRKPDLAVVIDSPAFNWRVARQMKKRGIPVVYYVCPQFWAWRQGRVRLLRKYVDQALVIFPFEERFFGDRGVNTKFVGHPLASLAPPRVARDDYAKQNGLDASKQWIALLPGSRLKEIRMNMPEMLRATKLLGSEYEFVLPVAPTVSRSLITGLLQSTPGIPAIRLVSETLPVLYHARTGIIASGTATVEAAMMELPFVMVYRVTRLTYLLGRWTVKVPHFAMVNLIAGEEVVPELIQRNFTAENVTNEMRKILPDGLPRKTMLAGLQRVKQMLAGEQGTSTDPSQRAAQVVLELCSTEKLSLNG